MQPLSEGMSPLEILTFMHFYNFFHHYHYLLGTLTINKLHNSKLTSWLLEVKPQGAQLLPRGGHLPFTSLGLVV